MNVEKMDISPELAAEWLSEEWPNRRINLAKVAEYQRDMENGKWRWDNGQTIVLGHDGQHRLSAIVGSGVTAHGALVVHGVEEEARYTIDIGRKRSLGDELMMRGETSFVQLAAVAGALYRYRNGPLPHGPKFGSTAGAGIGKPGSRSELLEIIRKNPGLRESARYSNAKNFRIAPRSLVGLSHFLLSEIDKEDARVFFESLFTGAELLAGEPVLALRNALIANTMAARKMSQRHILGLIFKAWNLYRDDREVKHLRLQKSETFPVPR